MGLWVGTACATVIRRQKCEKAQGHGETDTDASFSKSVGLSAMLKAPSCLRRVISKLFRQWKSCLPYKARG